jgi:hypothetical protein
MYSLNLHYNPSVLELVGPELCKKMNTNAIKTIYLLLFCSSFLSFVALFEHLNSPK